MAEKKKNKPAVTKRMHTQEAAEYSLATSPRFKKIAAKVEKGELTTAEALDMLVPKDLKGEERKKVRRQIAGAIGTQTARQFITNSRQKAAEKVNQPGGEYEKKQSRKPGMNKGGMTKKPMNEGIKALKKAAPAVAKKMGYKHGGKVHKKGYNKGGMAKCGASYKG